MERLTNAAQGYCEVYCKRFGRCFAEPGECSHQGEIAMYERLKEYESIGLTPEQVAAMKQELIDERYRHDRLQDFEVAEAQELAKAKAELADLKELWDVLPVYIQGTAIAVRKSMKEREVFDRAICALIKED